MNFLERLDSILAGDIAGILVYPLQEAIMQDDDDNIYSTSGLSVPKPGASVPIMITQAMRTQLKTRGLSDTQIDAMTPQQAWDYINMRQQSPPEPEIGIESDEPTAADVQSGGEGEWVGDEIPQGQEEVQIEGPDEAEVREEYEFLLERWNAGRLMLRILSTNQSPIKGDKLQSSERLAALEFFNPRSMLKLCFIIPVDARYGPDLIDIYKHNYSSPIPEVLTHIATIMMHIYKYARASQGDVAMPDKDTRQKAWYYFVNEDRYNYGIASTVDKILKLMQDLTSRLVSKRPPAQVVPVSPTSQLPAPNYWSTIAGRTKKFFGY